MKIQVRMRVRMSTEKTDYLKEDANLTTLKSIYPFVQHDFLLTKTRPV